MTIILKICKIEINFENFKWSNFFGYSYGISIKKGVKWFAFSFNDFFTAQIYSTEL